VVMRYGWICGLVLLGFGWWAFWWAFVVGVWGECWVVLWWGGGLVGGGWVGGGGAVGLRGGGGGGMCVGGLFCWSGGARGGVRFVRGGGVRAVGGPMLGEGVDGGVGLCAVVVSVCMGWGGLEWSLVGICFTEVLARG